METQEALTRMFLRLEEAQREITGSGDMAVGFRSGLRLAVVILEGIQKDHDAELAKAAQS